MHCSSASFLHCDCHFAMRSHNGSWHDVHFVSVQHWMPRINKKAEASWESKSTQPYESEEFTQLLCHNCCPTDVPRYLNLNVGNYMRFFKITRIVYGNLNRWGKLKFFLRALMNQKFWVTLKFWGKNFKTLSHRKNRVSNESIVLRKGPFFRVWLRDNLTKNSMESRIK